MCIEHRILNIFMIKCPLRCPEVLNSMRWTTHTHTQKKYCPYIEWRSKIKMTSSQSTIKHSYTSTYTQTCAVITMFTIKRNLRWKKCNFNSNVIDRAIELRACSPETIRRQHKLRNFPHSASLTHSRNAYGSGFYLCRKRWLNMFFNVCEKSSSPKWFIR